MLCCPGKCTHTQKEKKPALFVILIVRFREVNRAPLHRAAVERREDKPGSPGYSLGSEGQTLP